MKNYKIAVAGTGYVGLSLGVLFAQHHQVVAVDIVQAKVDMIRRKILSSKKSVRISRKTKKLFCSLPLGTIKITLHMLYHIERIWRMC